MIIERVKQADNYQAWSVAREITKRVQKEDWRAAHIEYMVPMLAGFPQAEIGLCCPEQGTAFHFISHYLP